MIDVFFDLVLLSAVFFLGWSAHRDRKRQREYDAIATAVIEGRMAEAAELSKAYNARYGVRV